MTRAPRLLVVQHEDEAPPAWFGDWLSAAGVALEVVQAHRGHRLPSTIDGYAGLLVLGGEMGAYDDQQHSWLAPTRSLIAGTVAAGRPMLGICLGHQLATVALGGEVARNAGGHARGLTPVGLTREGRDDVLLGSLPDEARAVMWNYDIATRLPAGAVLLAESPDGTVQAARFAPRAWGVQFHPEASPDIFDGWTLAKPTTAHPAGIDVPAAARQIRAAETELGQAWRPVAERFAAVLHDCSDAPAAQRVLESSVAAAAKGRVGSP